MFSITRITSLILAFTLGFSMCLGIIGFGTMAAVSKFRVRDLERYGIIANIPDDSFLEENPEVDIFDLSLLEFIDELKFITSLGDDVNLNYVQERYGLIFHEKLDAVLSDETRQMPLKQLFSKEGFGNVLGSVYIGDIENYICYNADGTEGGKPGVDGAYWTTKDGKKIVGIEEIIANFSINDFVSGNINTNTLFDEISIGDVLGYTQKGEDWVDKDGKPVTGVIGAFAGSTIHSVGTDVNNIKIGKLLGYEQNKDGDWTRFNEETGTTEMVSGVIGAFAGSTIQSVGGDIDELMVGEILGYTQHKENGPWFKTEIDKETNEEKEVEVTGALAFFANSKINDIGKEIEVAPLGKLLGYKQYEEKGPWFKTEINKETNLEEDVKVTGVMAVFADCNINGIGDKLEKAQLGELLGYYHIEGDDKTWYKTEIVTDKDGNEEEVPTKVTGAMAVFADSNINGVGDQIEKTEVGKLLGYYHTEEDSVNWYKTVTEKDKYGNETVTENVPVDGFMNKISASTINNMGEVFDTLVIGDIVKDMDTGIFSIIPADTNINKIGEEVNKSITNSPLQFFINNKLITFDSATQSLLDGLCAKKMVEISVTSEDYEKYYAAGNFEIKEGVCLVPAWRTQPLNQSFGYIISLFPLYSN